MRPPRRAALAVAAVGALALVPAACGQSDEDKVRDVLERFETALRERDYAEVCDDLLARDLVRRLNTIGLPCDVALRRALGQVLQAQVAVEAVKVRDGTALARITTTAVGQRPSRDTIRLVDQDGDWRISSLSGAQPPAPRRNPAGRPELE